MSERTKLILRKALELESSEASCGAEEKRLKISQDSADLNEPASAEDLLLDSSSYDVNVALSDGEIQDSDDSMDMEDCDFIPDIEDISSNDELLLFSEEEIEIKEKLKKEKELWKGRPKKGRNPKYPGQTFATRKKLKDSNKSHYTVKGKLKRAKEFCDYKCICLKRCGQRLEAGGKYEARLNEIPIKRKRAKDGPGKSYTRVYMLGEFEVYRDTYVRTYQISTKRINTALQKKRNCQVKDERGKSGGKKKINEETISKIIEHIKKFPTYVSHYSRSETEAKFLPYDLTESKMYELYIEENNPKVSFQFFKNIFYTNFNLRRKPPIKDTCNKCDMYSAQLKNLQNGSQIQVLNDEHDHHLESAQLARNQMKKDLKEASTNPLLETLSYDMEKVLGLPKLPTNIVYCKRQLNIYNEGIHSGSNNTAYCFLWRETHKTCNYFILMQKWDDIKSLLKFVPKDALEFYKVQNIENFQDDLEGFGPIADLSSMKLNCFVMFFLCNILIVNG
nr:unnamed protein product [Callosobruchus chinensis]